MRTNIQPRIAHGLAPPSKPLKYPTTRPALLDVRIKSKRERVALTAELPALLQRQAE